MFWGQKHVKKQAPSKSIWNSHWRPFRETPCQHEENTVSGSTLFSQKRRYPKNRRLQGAKGSRVILWFLFKRSNLCNCVCRNVTKGCSCACLALFVNRLIFFGFASANAEASCAALAINTSKWGPIGPSSNSKARGQRDTPVTDALGVVEPDLTRS